MSHFTVLVVGNNPEEQLIPFDENIVMEEYCSGEVFEEDKNQMLEHYKKERKFEGTFEECYKKHGKDWNNNTWKKNPDTEIWEEWSNYNPDSKWDWYQLGGRWSGLFKLKNNKTGELGEITLLDDERDKHELENQANNRADQALKGDIDFEYMRNEKEQSARNRYKKLAALFGGEIPKLEIIWKDLINSKDFKQGKVTIEELRKQYHNQPAMIRFKETIKNSDDRDLIWIDLVDYQCTEAEYAQNARDNAISTFAVLKDENWYERGGMGWWGIVCNEKETDAWNQEFAKLLDELPDETLLSIYDCHI